MPPLREHNTLWGGGSRLVLSMVMLVSVSFLLSANVVSAGQIVAASNASSTTTGFELKLRLPSMLYAVILNPLTPVAGQQVSVKSPPPPLSLGYCCQTGRGGGLFSLFFFLILSFLCFPSILSPSILTVR
jgi:hypothetical protein